MTFGLIQKPIGTLDLLLYLLRHGKSSVTAILSDTGMNKETFYRAVDRLRTLGFTYQEEQTGFPTYVYLGLTRAGEVLAQTLAPAAELLSATATSLETELGRLEKADDPATIPRRLEILDLLVGREFSAGRWDAAEEGASRLLDLTQKTDDVRREVRGRLVLGRILQKQDRHDAAVDQLEEALRIAETSESDDLASEAEYLLGSELERRGRWMEALERFASAADRASRASDRLGTARAREGTARVLGRQGRLEESFALLRDITAEYERIGAEDDLSRAYAALGATVYHLNPPDAIDWFEKAIEVARRVADPRMEAYSMANAAAYWIDARKFRKAETYLKRAKTVFEELGERAGLAAAELNIGNLLAAQDRWSDADEHFGSALRIARETANRFQEASVLFNRGQMMKRRNRRDDARSLLEEAARIFSELGSDERKARCENELRDLTTS